MSRIGIAGAGAFGTALATAYARAGHDVSLWARKGAETLQTARQNNDRLPGVGFPDQLTATASIEDLGSSDAILLCVPMQALAGLLSDHGTALSAAPLVACAKGIDLTTALGASALIQSCLPGARTALLSGPSFAVDIGAGLPTALTLASADPGLGETLQSLLSTSVLRLYRTEDVTGVEFGGALKNVVAIAAGIAAGANLGESARAAVITRGFAELRRVAVAHGAQDATLMGLSGLGDLALTCTSLRSRNYAAGIALGRGDRPDPTQTIEGLATARAIQGPADRLGLDIPLARMVSAVAEGETDVQSAVTDLLTRPLKTE